jgi:hypothetical protein
VKDQADVIGAAFHSFFTALVVIILLYMICCYFPATKQEHTGENASKPAVFLSI